MSKNIIASIFVFMLFVFYINYCMSAETNTEFLIDSAVQRIKELNLYGINIDAIDKSNFKHDIYDFDETIKLLYTVTFKPYLRFSIDASTGRIMELSISPPKTIHEGEDKPNKPKEEIIKQAEKYFRIINGEIPKDAFFYNCYFGVPGWNDTKHSYDGVWFVIWGRKVGDYEYKEDEIRVFINEKYGLDGYFYKFFSKYSPPSKISISQEKAIETTKKNMKSIIYSHYFEGNFSQYNVGKYDSSKLMIVNPNYSHKKGPRGMDISPKSFARLAWVVVFECVPKTKAMELPAGYCEAWIDAETGEVLGGTGSQNKPF